MTGYELNHDSHAENDPHPAKRLTSNVDQPIKTPIRKTPIGPTSEEIAKRLKLSVKE
jgi:hypothetical protein